MWFVSLLLPSLKNGSGQCHPTMTRRMTSPMTRPLRVELPGAVYHVTSRGQARHGFLLVCVVSLVCLVHLVYPVHLVR